MILICDSICVVLILMVDLVKMVGLVSLLGMMFGLIFVGIDLVKVIKY